MPDTNISALTALSAAPATGDLLPIVDVSDTTMAASGTTKYITVANLFKTPTVADLLTVTVATANTGVLASTGYSLTGSDATNMIDLAGTWNTSGTPTAIKLNMTDTASNAASLLMDLQVGAASKFKVSKAGSIAVPSGQAIRFDGDIASGPSAGYNHHYGSTQGGGAVISTCAGTDIFAVGQNSGVGVVNIGPYSFSTAISASADVFLYRDAAAVLALKNATTAQTFRVYGNTTGSHYLNMTHNGTNAVITVNGGGVLHISSLPTANPGPGILWNSAGTPAIGT